MDWGFNLSNEGVALASHSEESAEWKRSNPHLWSGGLNHDQNNEILDTSG